MGFWAQTDQSTKAPWVPAGRMAMLEPPKASYPSSSKTFFPLRRKRRASAPSKKPSASSQSCNPSANDSITGTGARKPHWSPLWQSPPEAPFAYQYRAHAAWPDIIVGALSTDFFIQTFTSYGFGKAFDAALSKNIPTKKKGKPAK